MSATRRHRYRRRDEERRDAFLANKCFICLGQEAYPSSPLPCCGRRLHEGCLRMWFVKAPGSRKSCPMCRKLLIPVNSGEAIPRIPEGAHLFTFNFVRYERQYTSYNGVDRDEIHWRWLNPSPIPPPPPGWREAMRGTRNNPQ